MNGGTPVTCASLRNFTALLCLLACCVVLVGGGDARDPCASWDYPQVDFTFTVIPSESFPVPVQFNGTWTTRSDEPIETWKWHVDDGPDRILSRGSSGYGWQNLRYSYSIYRDHFTVCAEGTTICGAGDQQCHDVKAYCTAPEAGFTLDVTEGPAPLEVHVTDTSEHTPGGATTWVYKKDGSTISRERDFSGAFTVPGEYTITQTVQKDCNPRSDSFSRRITVGPGIVRGMVMNISFPTTTPTIGVLGFYFTFNNTTPSATMTRAPATTTTGAAGPAATTVTAPGVTVPDGADAALPETAAGTGTLRVITEPAGAEVYVDEVLRGGSPVEIPGLAAGAHTLRLVRKDYRSMTVTVSVFSGGTSDYLTALVPEDNGAGMLPFIAGAFVVIAITGTGAYVFMKKKKAP